MHGQTYNMHLEKGFTRDNKRRIKDELDTNK